MNVKYGVLGQAMSPVPLGSFDESLRKLWTDYIDLLLIRQSFCFQAKRGRIFFPMHYYIFARARKKGYPCWDIWRNSSMLSNLMCLPLVLIKPSLAKVDRVRMALLVVMLAREAMSSLLSDTSKTLSSSMP